MEVLSDAAIGGKAGDVHRTVDLVVARHSRDLAWLRDVLTRDDALARACRVFVMDKGVGAPMALSDGMNADAGWCVRVCPVPNIGLDQYCHVRHLVDRYGDFAETTLFLQDHLMDHVDIYEEPIHDEHDFLTRMVREVRAHGRTQNARAYTQFGWFTPHPGFKVASTFPDWNEADSGYVFGDWFRTFVRADYPEAPETFLWFKNAIFGASRERLMSRPREDYARILTQFRAPRGEIDHYMERSWYYMISAGAEID
jgi:hypothetical protein